MNTSHSFLKRSLFLMCLLAALPLHARLGETEGQAQVRYGGAVPELVSAADKPLLEGAKEVVYSFQGWRIRAAYLAGKTARIEYVHLPENGVPKPISEEEIKAILEGEKGAFAWREEKPRMGNKDLNALKTLFEGRKWERSDHALASLKAGLLLTLEAREVEDYARKLAKQPKTGATPAPTVPKF